MPRQSSPGPVNNAASDSDQDTSSALFAPPEGFHNARSNVQRAMKRRGGERQDDAAAAAAPPRILVSKKSAMALTTNKTNNIINNDHSSTTNINNTYHGREADAGQDLFKPMLISRDAARDADGDGDGDAAAGSSSTTLVQKVSGWLLKIAKIIYAVGTSKTATVVVIMAVGCLIVERLLEYLGSLIPSMLNNVIPLPFSAAAQWMWSTVTKPDNAASSTPITAATETKEHAPG
ncbi:hypothetical protein ColTof4_01380 [Colletotrichum tofieldiae]|nr:hypothetical protein ColTof3_08633 [Colletotrichum tofieldiae]GKT68957.1 hypothetical protein ColTof4_01380 [Colletotrichum tofieldiae]GKT96816.1 hypothetical protein Ct61P_14666 [Colletotrichum tofieldiae]